MRLSLFLIFLLSYQQLTAQYCQSDGQQDAAQLQQVLSQTYNFLNQKYGDDLTNQYFGSNPNMCDMKNKLANLLMASAMILQSGCSTPHDDSAEVQDHQTPPGPDDRDFRDQNEGPQTDPSRHPSATRAQRPEPTPQPSIYDIPIDEMRAWEADRRKRKGQADFRAVEAIKKKLPKDKSQEFDQDRVRVYTEIFAKIAEKLEFDGFVSKEVLVSEDEENRVLLLAHSDTHLARTLNRLLGLAQCIRNDYKGANGKACDIYLIDKQGENQEEDNFAKTVGRSFEIKIDMGMADDLVQEVIPSERMQALWPEGKQLRFKFGEDKITFIFPTRVPVNSLLSERTYKDAGLLQTPWILRALEDLPLKAHWEVLSSEDLQGGAIQFVCEATHPVFERIWDYRSKFFPQEHSYRVFMGEFSPDTRFDCSDSPQKYQDKFLSLKEDSTKVDWMKFNRLIHEIKNKHAFVFKNQKKNP